MVKREKRLIKGIESIVKQIEIHEEKQKIAEKKGDIELVEYYSKEIGGLRKSRQNKEDKLKD